jgi:hypothetical protein
MPDSAHIETRLLVVAEMLEKAVAEVNRAMADLKFGVRDFTSVGTYEPPEDGVRSTHV